MMKKFISAVLAVVMIIATVSVLGITAIAENIDYSVGDIIEFGTYPQSEVKDSSLISALNAQSGIWKSYNYYTGSENGEDGKMTPSDYMRYKDVEYNGSKYRAVTFDSYRGWHTGFATTSPDGNTWQYENGYVANNVYWFKNEPLKWRILDKNTGLVICETIIDSQPYSNYLIKSADGDGGRFGQYYNSEGEFTSDWKTSSLRAWLNNDFYDTAFTNTQKFSILTSTNSNKSWGTLEEFLGYVGEYDSENTQDKVFLLSWDEARNTFYFTDFSKRRAKGSDYSKCQGLWVYKYEGSVLDECSEWRLRSAGIGSCYSCYVLSDGNATGGAGNDCLTGSTTCGVRPALKLNNLESYIVTSKYTTRFIVDGTTISESKYKEGEKIVLPKDPVKEGYTFKEWSPAVPATMPAEDMTFTAVFTKNPDIPTPDVSKAVISAPTGTKTVNWKYKAKLTATATNLPDGYKVVWYEGTKKVSDSGEFTTESLTSAHTYTAKIIDTKGKVVSTEKQEKTVTIEVKSDPISKLISLFTRLFGSGVTNIK